MRRAPNVLHQVLRCASSQLNQRVGVGAVGRPASFGCSIQQRHKVTVPSAAGAVRRSRLKPKLPKAKFDALSSSFLERVEQALEPLQPPMNEDFEISHPKAASMLIRTNSKEFLLEVVDAKQQIHLTSPISGLRMYEWNARTRRWEDETDAHDIEGLLTRDLMRLCSGVPAF